MARFLRHIRPVALGVGLLVIVGHTVSLHAQASRPRLLVVLMVDQMRADYLTTYRALWTGGFRRLLDEGAWYQQAYYPFAGTTTCAGHASVSTGALPSRHGMVMNTWWDRTYSQVVACADDPNALNLSYGKSVNASGESATRLLVPTLADELRRQTSPSPRVVSLSLKARAAVTLAGQQPDAVAWVGDQGAWVSSTGFAAGLSPAIAKYVASHSVEHQLFQAWDRSLPESRYVHERRAVGARTDAWQGTFPHTLQTWDEWQASPLSDEYLANMALDVASTMQLGESDRTDMLAISFSALDLVGHIYGPNSHEVQDVLARLDRTLAMLLQGLDARVGKGRYVVALSADHGVSSPPEFSSAAGIDAGRIPLRAIPDAAQRAVTSVLGRGRWVNRLMNTDLYLQNGVFDVLSETPGGLQVVRDGIAAVAGVQAVYTREDISHRPVTDPLLGQIANGFFPERSGDIVIVFKPHWLVGGNGGANHGTQHPYDTHVPIMLFGHGIEPGVFDRAVTPLDIAPTLARLAGISLPHAQGTALTEALSSSSVSEVKSRRSNQTR